MDGVSTDLAVAGVDRETAHRLLYFMMLQRALEDRCIKIYYQGRIPAACFTGWGHEAIAVGAAAALDDHDLMAPMHRDLGAYLVRGVEPREYLAQFMARVGGLTRGRDGNMHFGKLASGVLPFISHMAASLPVACGMALACVMRGEPRVVVSFFGDGASSTGACHEAMNFASTMRLPVIFILENNQFAYSTPLRRQTAVPDLAVRAAGYAMPGSVIDGNDVLAVHRATRDAVDRARSGGGPALIECKTMRMRGHSEADDMSYVPKELLAEWKARDPIDRCVRDLTNRGLLSEPDLQALAARIAREVDDADAWADASPLPDGAEAATGVWCTDEDAQQ